MRLIEGLALWFVGQHTVRSDERSRRRRERRRRSRNRVLKASRATTPR